MQPALRPGDRLLVWRWARPRVGDLVVFFEPDGRLVVRGDNVNVSRDSREYGAVPSRLVIGTAVYRYLPGPRRGRL